MFINYILSTTSKMLLGDLQRCRRLVASMRGLVIMSSLRLQLLQDAQVALVAREERQRNALTRTNGPPPSPRTEYLRKFRGQHICIIQRQWRKYRWKRLLVEKLKLERKWRAKRGNKHLELNATTIQRVFRGYCVRKRRYKKPITSICAAVAHARQPSRLERLHSSRIEYHHRLEDRRSALVNAQRDLDIITNDMIATESKITKAVTTNAMTGKTASLFIDTKLLDGTVVRMEAHQLLVHEMSEIDRLTETAAHLEEELRDLQATDPVAHQAACSIQARFRQYREQQRNELNRKAKRLADLRRRLSSARCYERMNVGFLKRQQETWRRSAIIIFGLYQIMKARQLLHLYRQQRAVAIIEKAYLQKRNRVDAQARVAWRRTKLRAQLFSLRRLRRALVKSWGSWRDAVAQEKLRRSRILKALEDGHSRWIASKARRLQRTFRRAMKLRSTLDDQVMPILHPMLRYMSEAAVASSTIPRDQFLQFYQQVTQTIHAWRVPSTHLYFLAQRYTLSLEVFFLEEIWQWILGQHDNSTVWFLDLRSPLPIRTLRFLAPLSRFFDQYDRISYQVDQIWLHYEAIHCVREYLVLLFRHDAIAYTPSTTFSSHARNQAVKTLQQRMDEEASDRKQISTTPVIKTTEKSPFTTFHCVWSDLCEQCLSMETIVSTRDCKECGHRYLEKSTATQPSHAAVARSLATDNTYQNHPQWIKHTERCDFVVINAFFHALAPRGHVHRDLYMHTTLWKVALAKAYDPIIALYEKVEIRTLNDLLCASYERWATLLPDQVSAKLALFLRLIKQELIVIQKQAMMGS